MHNFWDWTKMPRSTVLYLCFVSFGNVSSSSFLPIFFLHSRRLFFDSSSSSRKLNEFFGWMCFTWNVHLWKWLLCVNCMSCAAIYLECYVILKWSKKEESGRRRSESERKREMKIGEMERNLKKHCWKWRRILNNLLRYKFLVIWNSTLCRRKLFVTNFTEPNRTEFYSERGWSIILVLFGHVIKNGKNELAFLSEILYNLHYENIEFSVLEILFISSSRRRFPFSGVKKVTCTMAPSSTIYFISISISISNIQSNLSHGNIQSVCACVCVYNMQYAYVYGNITSICNDIYA